LREHPKNRPATLVALERHLTTMLGTEATQAKVCTLIERLQREGIVAVNGQKIKFANLGGEN
jgi:predicted methyltransferase